ncbi:MAG: hypothetical protein V5B36_08725 [Candidatus Accumulibacter sp. UW25]|jgi:hypothetical protein
MLTPLEGVPIGASLPLAVNAVKNDRVEVISAPIQIPIHQNQK